MAAKASSLGYEHLRLEFRRVLDSAKTAAHYPSLADYRLRIITVGFRSADISAKRILTTFPANSTFRLGNPTRERRMNDV